MPFRLIGIGGRRRNETVRVLHSVSLQDARDAAAALLRQQPHLEGVEIFDLVRFIEVVEHPPQPEPSGDPERA